ncbi:nitronate monooxygenase family protein [Chromobacterium sp. ASV23]|uniref:NAD(P)H-dependent flavin oxidoreductase n=1 Tax=Chromobacterium sp. ASV23 TaxID=2795110 RepID=UPI00210769CD|nr:nitronate monooxygenase [Chromobacterium sp. ASV23]
MTRFNSAVTELFGIKHPVVLAPMGGVSGGRLAAAVSRAGGLGLVGASYGDPDWMKAELGLMADVEQPWGVGLVMFTVAKRFELLDLALSYGPNVVALSFGDVKPFLKPIREQGAKVVVQVHEVEQALAALDAGADALIVQGAEAGGHSLRRASLPLIPAVRDAVGSAAPLIAAGGIADGRGMAAALALGADGVMLGTRLVAAEEALPSPAFKQRLLQAVAGDTVRTRAFDLVRGIEWPQEYSGRALANDFSDVWASREGDLLTAPAEVAAAYVEAVRNDDLNVRAIWSGEVVDLVRDVQPAGRIVEELVSGAQAELTRAQRFFS